MQKVAETRKEAEDIYAVLAQTGTSSAGTPAATRWNPEHVTRSARQSLFQSDPMAYMEQKLAYDNQVNEYQQRLNYLQQHVQATQETSRQLGRPTLPKSRAIEGFHPELFDEEKGAEMKSGLVSTAAEAYGFQPEELAALMDHRHVRVLMDAVAYQLNSEWQEEGRAKVQNKVVRSKKRKVTAEARLGRSNAPAEEVRQHRRRYRLNV